MQRPKGSDIRNSLDSVTGAGDEAAVAEAETSSGAEGRLDLSRDASQIADVLTGLHGKEGCQLQMNRFRGRRGEADSRDQRVRLDIHSDGARVAIDRRRLMVIKDGLSQHQ